MHTNRKRILFYSFLLLFMMACRTYACTYTSQPALGVGCQRFFELPTPSGSPQGYTCSISCPGISGEYKFDIYGNGDLSALFGLTFEQVQAQYCPVPQAEAKTAPTEPPTEEPPTEEPASTEPPAASAPLQPYLTGAFTTCDNIARYVNFTIADPAAPFNPATHKVLFNGKEATCTRAASAFDVLTCIYPPAPYGPPAIIEVFNGEQRVNEFKFDGGKICDPAPQPNPNDNEEPAATEAPTEPTD